MHAHDLEPVTALPVSPATSSEQRPDERPNERPGTPADTPANATVKQIIATVHSEEPGEGWWLDDGHQRRLARRAESCLLALAVGDRVWAVGDATHGLYVLAVLERMAAGTAPTLAFEGNVAVSAGGRMTLSAREGMDLHTPQGLGVSADELTVQARTGRAAIQELSLLARRVFASLARVTHVGEVLELLVDRVTQRSKHSVRAIEGVDRTVAETVDLQAQGTAHIQANHALVNGKELVKMDGGQIHLG